MFPPTLTLVEDDESYRNHLQRHLEAAGIRVRAFADSNPLLADPAAYDSDFYVLDLMLPGVPGEELIRVLRLRTDAGIVAVSGKLDGHVFEDVMAAGADMHLAKPVSLEQVKLAIAAVWRRSSRDSVMTRHEWVLDVAQRLLTSPTGVTVKLGESDAALLACFPAAAGQPVSHQQINEALGRPMRELPDNSLHALIYRLRRRIESATGGVLPLQAQSRVGYVFKAPISLGPSAPAS